MQTSKLLWALFAAAALTAGCATEHAASAEKPAAEHASAPAEHAPAAAEKAAEHAKPAAAAAEAKKKKTKASKEPAAKSDAAKPIAAAPAAETAKADAPKTEAPKSEQKGGALSEADGVALAKKSNCFACHALDHKVVGPGWKDVANKYRGQGDAEAKLIAKVAKGGSGVWGGTAMPANSPAVKDADIKALVKFILSLK